MAHGSEDTEDLRGYIENIIDESYNIFNSEKLDEKQKYNKIKRLHYGTINA